MRNDFRFMTLAVGIMAFATSVPGQVTGPAIGESWQMATQFAATGDLEQAEQSLSEAMAMASQLAIARMPAYAKAAAGLAIESEMAGNGDIADWAIDAAYRLDPRSPDVAFAHADLLRIRSGLGGAISPLSRGISAVFGSRTTSMIARSDFLVSLAVAILLIGAGFGVAMVTRYGRSIMHDWRESLSGRVSAGTATILAFALLFLPVFLWLNPFWLIPWWFLITMSYAGRAEKVAIIIVLIGIGLTPLLMAWSAYRIVESRNPVVRAVEATYEDIWDPEIIKAASELTQALPDEARIQVIAGDLALIAGAENQALIHFQRAVQLDDTHAGAHLNIGNIHFLHQDFPAATFRYERAAQLDPGMAIAFLNNSIVAGETFQFEKQSEQIALARAASREVTDRLRTPKRKVFLYRIPWGEVPELVAQARASENPLFGSYARFDVTAALMHPVALGSAAVLALGLLLGVMRNRKGRAGQCVKCGRTFCARCKSSRESATYCTQCIHIYIKRDGVIADAKRRKMDEITKFHRGTLRTRRLMSAFIPGSASVLGGRPFRGLLLMLIFALALAIAFLTGRLAPIATPAETMQQVMRYASIALAAVVWLVAFIPALRAKVQAG